MGVECSYVRLDFEENCISLTTGNDAGSGTYSVDAVKIGGESGHSFYYPSVMLKDLFKTVDGTMILRLDARGYLLVFNRTDKYLITPITSAAVEKQNKKYEEQMKKARGETADKSAKKTRSAKKAA